MSNAVGAEDFLFELGTEELPPLALPELERALAESLRSALAAAGIAPVSYTHLTLPTIYSV